MSQIIAFHLYLTGWSQCDLLSPLDRYGHRGPWSFVHWADVTKVPSVLRAGSGAQAIWLQSLGLEPLHPSASQKAGPRSTGTWSSH